MNEQNEDKVVYVLRGISGSGKSTKARKLSMGNPSRVFSTDDYFEQFGKYVFNPRELPKAHSWNRKRVEEAMKQGLSPIIVDNTHTELWEAKPYVLMAQKFGYEVKFEESDAPWRFDAEELAKRNIHKVPLSSIKRMIERYEPHDKFTVENVLLSKSPWEK